MHLMNIMGDVTGLGSLDQRGQIYGTKGTPTLLIVGLALVAFIGEEVPDDPTSASDFISDFASSLLSF